MAIFKNIVDYPLPITLIAQIMVFLITQGAPQITNIVALFAPLDFRGNKAELNGYTWMRPAMAAQQGRGNNRRN